jgi:acyl-CoA thioesterase I
MAGARTADRGGCTSNFLLWHWVTSMSSDRLRFIGCLAVTLACVQLEGSAQPTPRVDTRPVIVAFGDSLTAGFGADPGKSFPDFLQKDLDQAGLHWHVVNAGVSGNTTTDGVARLSEVLAYKPRVTIVEFGGNDGLRGLPIATTSANLDQIIRALRDSGSAVVLAGMTLPPNYGPDYIGPFQQVYKDLADKYKVARIPFLLEGVATNPNLMQRDGIHPTAQGNQMVASLVMRYLKPLLH